MIDDPDDVAETDDDRNHENVDQTLEDSCAAAGGLGPEVFTDL